MSELGATPTVLSQSLTCASLEEAPALALMGQLVADGEVGILLCRYHHLLMHKG